MDEILNLIESVSEVSSSHSFNVCDLEKDGVLHEEFTFETTLIFYMNAEALF